MTTGAADRAVHPADASWYARLRITAAVRTGIGRADALPLHADEVGGLAITTEPAPRATTSEILPRLTDLVLVATAGAAGARLTLRSTAAKTGSGLADVVVVAAAGGTALRSAGTTHALPALLVADLQHIGARAAGARPAAPIRPALLAGAVRGTAVSSRVALVGWSKTTAIGAAAGGASWTVHTAALAYRGRTDLVEAVAAAAVTVLLAGAAVRDTGVRLFATLPTTTLILVLPGVAVVLALMLAVAPTAPVRILASLDPISWLLCLGIIAGDAGQRPGQGQGREDGDQPASSVATSECAHEAIKAGGVHRLPLASGNVRQRRWVFTLWCVMEDSLERRAPTEARHRT